MSDTLAGLLQVGRTRRRPGCLLEAAGRLHGPRLHQQQATCASSASSTALVGVDADRRPALARLRAALSSRSRWSASLLLYLLQRVQSHLPLSLGFPGVAPALAFNTAASFVTNTNWQAYSGESTMGHLVQMAGLAVQNFVSAAVGIAVAVALIRGLRPLDAPTGSATSGSTWSGVTVRVLLPIAFVAAVVLVAHGRGAELLLRAPTSRPWPARHQTLTGGPVASQEAIKELGTNGGGFYNANSAHPFENPNPLTNLFEIFLLLVIPVALTRTFGTMVGDKRQGYAILAAMGVLWSAALVAVTTLEMHHPGSRRPGGRRGDGGQGDAVRRSRHRRSSPCPPRVRRPARSTPSTRLVQRASAAAC